MQLADYLTDQRVSYEPLMHPPAFTAQRRARTLHVHGGRVAKAILLYGPEGYFLAILPATHRIDLTRLARHLGGSVRLADRPEAARLVRDREWGRVLPFGTLHGV